MNNEIESFSENNLFNICVIGVGNGGIRAINMMHGKGVPGVEYVICDTDEILLGESKVSHKIHIKDKKSLSEHNIIQLKKYTQPATVLFVFAGMGGDIGENLLPKIIEIISQENIWTICVLTIPFVFEGADKIERAKEGIEQIKCLNNSVIELNSQLILQQHPETKQSEAFEKLHNIQFELLTNIEKSLPWHSYISTDFSDFYSKFKDIRQTVIGRGISTGENRIQKAINTASEFPLFDQIDLASFDIIYIMIHCSQDYQLKMEEVEQIYLFEECLRANIILIWSACFDNDLQEKAEVVAIAGKLNGSVPKFV